MKKTLQVLITWLKSFAKQYDNPQLAEDILERSMKPLGW